MPASASPDAAGKGPVSGARPAAGGARALAGRRLLAGAAVAALTLTSVTAGADSFPYVDRQGHVHLITVPDSPPSDTTAPPDAPAEAPGALPRGPSRAPASSPSFPDDRPSPPALPDRLFSDAPGAPAAPDLRSPPLAGGFSGVTPYLDIVASAAAHYGLPPELILAVMRIESRFDARAVSRSGAQGLMQLMPPTAADMLVTDPFDPRQNIFGGARFLRILVNRMGGNVVLALAAYNAGPGAVERWGGIPPYPETTAYVINVLAVYHHLLLAASAVGP